MATALRNAMYFDEDTLHRRSLEQEPIQNMEPEMDYPLDDEAISNEKKTKNPLLALQVPTPPPPLPLPSSLPPPQSSPPPRALTRGGCSKCGRSCWRNRTSSTFRRAAKRRGRRTRTRRTTGRPPSSRTRASRRSDSSPIIVIVIISCKNKTEPKSRRARRRRRGRAEEETGSWWSCRGPTSPDRSGVLERSLSLRCSPTPLPPSLAHHQLVSFIYPPLPLPPSCAPHFRPPPKPLHYSFWFGEHAITLGCTCLFLVVSDPDNATNALRRRSSSCRAAVRRVRCWRGGGRTRAAAARARPEEQQTGRASCRA